ncbi:MAG: zinc-ribbon domain-containing protein [Myxococcota bacterium]|nr:zinc-ribbon domain-containing protein [Myxococcota bacterium]
MKFRCEHCSTKYSLQDDTIRGRVLKIRCRQCKGVMVVRDPERSLGALDSLSADDLRSYLAKSGETPNQTIDNWFLAKGGERQGPMSQAEVSSRLSRGEFSAADHAWREGMSGWLPVRDVPELATLLDDMTGGSTVAPTAPAVPPASPPAVQPTPELRPVKTGLAGREVSGEVSAAVSSPLLVRDDSVSAIGDETRIFLLASGLQQGARRRLIIFGSILVLLLGLGVGMQQGIIGNPFAKSMQKASFKTSGQASYVRLIGLSGKAGATSRERSIVAAAVIENLSYQDRVIIEGWAFEMMPLKDDSVEIRLGRANFSKCTAVEQQTDGVPPTSADAFDCPAGQPTFRSFPNSKEAQLALDAVQELKALKKVRGQFADSKDLLVVRPYHRGQSINAAEGRAMLECLMGGCRDEVLKAQYKAADTKVRAKMRAESRKRRKDSSDDDELDMIVVDEDPAEAEEQRLRQSTKVSAADLARMAALQSALGTVRLPLPTLSAPPGRATQLDVKAAAKVIERGQRGITACVSRAMTRGQRMFGELRARISIQPSGKVAKFDILSADYKGTDVARCINSKVRRWRFPSFPGKEIVPVEVPWKLPRR